MRSNKYLFKAYCVLSTTPNTQQRASAWETRTNEQAQAPPLSPFCMTYTEPPFMGNLAPSLISLGYLKNPCSFSCLISLGNWMTESVYT